MAQQIRALAAPKGSGFGSQNPNWGGDEGKGCSHAETCKNKS